MGKEYDLREILDGDFEEEFASGFEDKMPDDYCRQEDGCTGSPWFAPWTHGGTEIEDWYDPKLTAEGMGSAWAEKCLLDWETMMADEGNRLTAEEEAKGDIIRLEHVKAILPASRSEYYHWYDMQNEPQDAYLELDPDKGTLIADWNAEIGNAVPNDVYHGRVLRWGFPADMCLRDVRERMEQAAPFADIVVQGYFEECDGSNMVGRLDQEACKASEEICHILEYGEPSQATRQEPEGR